MLMKQKRFNLFSIPQSSAYGDGQRRSMPMSGCGPRLAIAALFVAFALFKYFSLPSEVNKFTGREQKLNLNENEEIQMGLASAPKMAQMHGGLSPDVEARALVKKVGQRLVKATNADETPYQYDFHLLADRKTVNAFALPGGQVFITEALFRMLKTEDELAGVLGHEIGHVVGRHSSEQIAKSNLLGGLTTAAVIATSSDQGNNGSVQLANLVNQLVSTKYGRADEIESDKLGVRFLHESGYNPEALIRVMEVLKQASGGGGGPEFMSTHPSPENRIQLIQEEIAKLKR
ncbi:M48 family metallopeptidase [soil metagenome]